VTRKHRFAIAAAVAAALLLAWWLRRDTADTPPATATSAPRAEAAIPAAAAPLPRPRAAADMRAVVADAKAPIIDEVLLEKSEVCDGEENLVTVKARAPDPEDEPFLRYMIAGSTGRSVIVHGSSEPGAHAHAEVIAFGRNGVSTSVPLPRFTVKPCKAPHKLLLTYRMLPNRPAEIELTATLVAHGAPRPLQPVRFVWTFGDGTTTETSVPVEVHDYSRRPQQTLMSSFVVGCTAYAQSGEKVEGRTSLELTNLAFETFAYKGVVKLSGELVPRFAEVDAAGAVTQRIRLWHSHDRPVQIQRLTRTRLAMGQRPAAEDVSTSVLGIAQIGAGQTAESRPIRLDAAEDREVYGFEYHVEGVTDDGWPVSGNFAIMRPPPPPTPERHTPVLDPVLRAKILRARELLARQFVTDEDIWRLEREGLMTDLVIEPAAPPREPPPRRPPAPPPPPPPPPR
jgi:hypothetical protein